MEILGKKLKEATRKQGYGITLNGVLRHDNARLQVAMETVQVAVKIELSVMPLHTLES